jgi:hypothetical protein
MTPPANPGFHEQSDDYASCFWEVRDSQAKSQYRFYEFLREYRERHCTHNPEFNTQGHYDFDAVLDG